MSKVDYIDEKGATKEFIEDLRELILKYEVAKTTIWRSLAFFSLEEAKGALNRDLEEWEKKLTNE